MKKWIRNIAIGMALASLKNVTIVKNLLAKLKAHSVWVGRIGLLMFTAIAAVKYYYPALPIDDGVEILGIVFSWLAIEIGLNQSEVDEIKSVANVPFDPSQLISIAGIDLPSPESLGFPKKKVTSDSEEK